MSGNFPSGFEGFQAQLEAMAEAAGGDELAWMAAEHIFAQAIEGRRHSAPADRDRFAYPGPHLGGWVRASPLQWSEATERAVSALQAGAAKLEPGEKFRLVWTHSRMVRATSQAAIPLVNRRGLHFHILPMGDALARANGFNFRSYYREFRTEAGADAFFPRLAEREFKLP